MGRFLRGLLIVQQTTDEVWLTSPPQLTAQTKPSRMATEHGRSPKVGSTACSLRKRSSSTVNKEM
eukprot:Awhi_evm1s3684